MAIYSARMSLPEPSQSAKLAKSSSTLRRIVHVVRGRPGPERPSCLAVRPSRQLGPHHCRHLHRGGALPLPHLHPLIGLSFADSLAASALSNLRGARDLVTLGCVP